MTPNEHLIKKRNFCFISVGLVKTPPPAIMSAYMVAMAMSLSDRLSLAGLGTIGSSISNLVIFDMVPF